MSEKDSPTIDALKTSADLQSDLIRNLSTQPSLNDMMTKIVYKTAEVLKASASTIFTVGPEGHATQRAGSGYQEKFTDMHDVRVIPASAVPEKPDKGEELGLTGWILSTGKPFLARTPEELKSHPHYLNREQIPGEEIKLQSFLGVPLRGLHGEVMGLIKAERRLPYPGDAPIQSFSVEDQLALEMIARVASRCITYLEMAQNGQQTEAITTWARDVVADAVATEGELDSFLDMVVNVSAAAMRADSCGIFLKDENTLTQRAGSGSHALRSLIRAYRLPDIEKIQPCKEVALCNPKTCPFKQNGDKASFRLTEKSLAEMRDKRVPKEILAALTPLVQKGYREEKEFLDAVKQEIGAVQASNYKELILRHSEVRVGLTAWIAATGKAFHASNFEELSVHCHHRGGFDRWNFTKGETQCGAFLGVPLQVGGMIKGVIKVENISTVGLPDSRDFSDSDQRCFEILAQDIALAIMRLQNQIPARYRIIRDAQDTILEILRGGLGISDLAKKVVNETRVLFNAGACALFLKEGNRLIQPRWAASGWAESGPKVREYMLVEEEQIKDNPTPEEKVGLTVWIAVKQKKFTARSNLELRMHPHHKGTFDQYNFTAAEQCETFMGFPLLISEGSETKPKLVGVLKVETKMKKGGEEKEYTYFNELDELVFELIANSAAIAIQNARLLESRHWAERILAQPDSNAVLQALYGFLQGREEVMNTLDHTARTVLRDKPDRADIIQGFARLLEPGFSAANLGQLAKQMMPPLKNLLSFLAKAIQVQNFSDYYDLYEESQSTDFLPLGSLTAQDYFLHECVELFLNVMNDTNRQLRDYQSNPTRRTILKDSIELLQDTQKDRLSQMSLFEKRVLGRIFDQWRQVIQKEYEKFQKIPNPYITGNPVKIPEMFWGREDIFQFISENLSGTVQDRTLVLHGQRRTGKTSILYQLLAGRLGRDFVPILIDMQQLALVNSTEEFLEGVSFIIRQAVQKAGLGEMHVSAVQTEMTSPTMKFDRLLDILEEKLGNRRAVLMFDEFEVLEERITKGKLEENLLQYLRSLLQHRTHLVFIFTGAHRLEELSRDYWSVFFNIALYKRVSFLQPKDAALLIREPVKDALEIDQQATQEIIRLTNAHPFFIQLICWALVNHCNDHECNSAMIDDVNKVVQEILETGEPHFAYIWTQAQGTVERLALVGLAQTLDRNKEWVQLDEIVKELSAYGQLPYKRKDFVNAFDQLVKREVLENNKDGPLAYRFQVELLRLWVKQTQSIPAILERGA